MLESYAPRHYVCKAGLPDHILLRPGKLEPNERIITHTLTIIGRAWGAAFAKRVGVGSMRPQHGMPEFNSGVHAHLRDRSERRRAEDAHFAEIGAERILENHGRFGE
jgi:hypothetical protein